MKKLRPLFSPDLNHSHNSSRSLHHCPSCRCQSPGSAIQLKNRENIVNIYTKGRNPTGQVKSGLKITSTEAGSKLAINTKELLSQKSIRSQDSANQQKCFHRFSEHNHRPTSPINQWALNSGISARQKPVVTIRYLSPKRQIYRVNSENNINFRPLSFRDSKQPFDQNSFSKPSLNVGNYVPSNQERERNFALTRSLYYQGNPPQELAKIQSELPAKPRILSGQRFRKSDSSSITNYASKVNEQLQTVSIGVGTSMSLLKSLESSKKDEILQPSEKSSKGSEKISNKIRMNKNVKGRIERGDAQKNHKQNQFIRKDEAWIAVESETVKRSTPAQSYEEQFGKNQNTTIQPERHVATKELPTVDKSIKTEAPRLKYIFPIKPTSQSIEVQMQSRSALLNTLSDQNGSACNSSQRNGITTLDKIVYPEKSPKQANSSKIDTQTSKCPESRFAFYKKKSNVEVQQEKSNKKAKSRSRSNEDREKRHYMRNAMNIPQVIVAREGRESIELAKEIMRQLDLYYNYYDFKNQSQGSFQGKR